MNEQNRFLCFHLGHEEYAISLLCVKEVIGVPDITLIPHMPSFFLGVMPVRGALISIMDLRIKMGLPLMPQHEPAVIIVDLGHVSLGLMVDSIHAVVQVQKEELQDAVFLEHLQKPDVVIGAFRKGHSSVFILELSRILNEKERLFLSQKSIVTAA